MKYDELKINFIECPMCNLFINLYYAKPHILTMKCKACQNLLIKTQGKKIFNIILLTYIKRINQLRSELKQDLQLDEENDEEIKDDISVLTG